MLQVVLEFMHTCISRLQEVGVGLPPGVELSSTDSGGWWTSEDVEAKKELQTTCTATQKL